MITKKLLTGLIEGKKLRRDTWNQNFYIGIGDDEILYQVDTETGEKTYIELSFHHKKPLVCSWSEYKELYTFKEMFDMMRNLPSRVFRLTYTDGSYNLYKLKHDDRYRMLTSDSVNSAIWYEVSLTRTIEMATSDEKRFELVYFNSECSN